MRVEKDHRVAFQSSSATLSKGFSYRRGLPRRGWRIRLLPGRNGIAHEDVDPMTGQRRQSPNGERPIATYDSLYVHCCHGFPFPLYHAIHAGQNQAYRGSQEICPNCHVPGSAFLQKDAMFGVRHSEVFLRNALSAAPSGSCPARTAGVQQVKGQTKPKGETENAPPPGESGAAGRLKVRSTKCKGRRPERKG